LARRGRATSAVAISPAGLWHARERIWARSILRALRWLARNTLPPAALARIPACRALFLGPGMARPWRVEADAAVEMPRLYGNAPGFDETLRHSFDHQPLGLDGIRVPVLLLWGTRDVLLLPRQGRRFERLIPDCELRYLDGLGHMPMSDDPQLVADQIRRWCGQRAAAPV
jgi:pimeloyl-ACP methyl ester carboxylesterase